MYSEGGAVCKKHYIVHKSLEVKQYLVKKAKGQAISCKGKSQISM